MARRSYKRDSIGRFAGGGGGGGSKAASTRATNTARAAGLKAKGTTGLGARVKAKGFAGGKGAQERAGGLRTGGRISGKGMAFTVGRGGKQSAGQRAATAGAMRMKSRGGTINKAARTSKAPANPARDRFKELSSAARKSSPHRSAEENRKAAGARRSMDAMVKNRGRKAAPRKRPVLDAIARPIVRAMSRRR